jgi:hypothetical protein
VNRTRDQAVTLEATQSQRQHALRDAMNRPANFVEPHRAAPLAQQLHNQHGPFVADAGQRLADHGALNHVLEPVAFFKPLALFETIFHLEAIRRLDAASRPDTAPCPGAIYRLGAPCCFDAARPLDETRRLDGILRLNAPSRLDAASHLEATSSFDAASRLDPPRGFDATRRLDAAAPRPHRLINVTGFQISAFLRVSPIVTILALVTKRNQAT